MEEGNTSSPIFKSRALEILKNNLDLFVFSRYFANKLYFHLETEKEFDEFLKERVEKECLTLFINKFEIVRKGLVNEEFAQKIKYRIQQNKAIDWVAIGKNDDNSQWSAWINNKEDFEEVFEDELGKEIIIIKDKNWFDEKNTFHAYVPDQDGIVRKGSY